MSIHHIASREWAAELVAAEAKGIGRKAPAAPLDVPLLYRAGTLTDIARDGFAPVTVVRRRALSAAAFLYPEGISR